MVNDGTRHTPACEGSTRLYFYTPDLDGFNAFEADDEQYRTLKNVVYRTPGDAWSTPELKIRRGKKKLPSDFPSPISDCPVLSRRAWACLEPLIRNGVEPLPLRSKSDDYVLLNVLARCPAFDEERSGGVRRDRWGNIFDAHQWAFRPGVRFECDLFRINTEVARVFLTERFREVVESNKLEGLLWLPVPVAEQDE